MSSLNNRNGGGGEPVSKRDQYYLFSIYCNVDRTMYFLGRLVETSSGTERH